MDEGWYDLTSSDEDLSDEVAYLDARRFLQRHPQNQHWVIIQDEGELLEEVQK
jgi:hypothetical protein